MKYQLRINALLQAIIISTVAMILLGASVKFSVGSVWDDSYMYVRYADNLIVRGTLSFNPGHSPTYGLTSLGFLCLIVPLRLVLPHSPALVVATASLLSGLVFLALLSVLLMQRIGGLRSTRLWIIVIVFLSLVGALPSLTTHFVSGMDTTFALAYLAAYILFIEWHSRLQSIPSMLMTGGWSAFAFLVRPDLAVYTLVVPAAMAALAPEARARKVALSLLGISAVGIGLEMYISSLVLKTPLPLPFYVKSLTFYGRHIKSVYNHVPVHELVKYVSSYPLLFSAIILVMVDFGGWWNKTPANEKGYLLATVFFAGYYLFSVLQIMYYEQRFYYPTLPAVIYLAARAMARIIPILGRRKIVLRVFDAGRPGWAVVLVIFLGVGLLLRTPVKHTGAEALRLFRAHETLRFDPILDYRTNFRDHWYRLDEFSRLPNDLVIATTEVGHPLAMNPDKVILDLSGLNETTIARHGLSPEKLIQTRHPDLVYMPHPDYVEMINGILNDLYFVAHYQYYPSSSLGTRMGLALWRDSRHFSDMQRIVETANSAVEGIR